MASLLLPNNSPAKKTCPIALNLLHTCTFFLPLGPHLTHWQRNLNLLYTQQKVMFFHPKKNIPEVKCCLKGYCICTACSISVLNTDDNERRQPLENAELQSVVSGTKVCLSFHPDSSPALSPGLRPHSPLPSAGADTELGSTGFPLRTISPKVSHSKKVHSTNI